MPKFFKPHVYLTDGSEMVVVDDDKENYIMSLYPVAGSEIDTKIYHYSEIYGYTHVVKPRVTLDQLDLMRKIVGLDEKDKPYKNCIYVSEYTPEYNIVNELVHMNLASKDGDIYSLTKLGYKFLGFSVDK